MVRCYSSSNGEDLGGFPFLPSFVARGWLNAAHCRMTPFSPLQQ